MNVLEVRNISIGFSGKMVHQDISFDLRENESLGLLGPSGSGKSVLLRMLIGLERPDSGTTLFKGRRIDNLEEKEFFEIRKNISYVFQNGALFDSMNVYENLAYPLREHEKLSEEEEQRRIKQALEVVGLPNSAQAMPSELSGGMQKRIGLARSLMLNPEVILYDEPTAGLDPKNTANVVEIMKRLKAKNIASIFVTHDMPAAMQVCDRIVIIGGGKVQFTGSPEEMRNSNSPAVQEFFAMDYKGKLSQEQV